MFPLYGPHKPPRCPQEDLSTPPMATKRLLRCLQEFTRHFAGAQKLRYRQEDPRVPQEGTHRCSNASFKSQYHTQLGFLWCFLNCGQLVAFRFSINMINSNYTRRVRQLNSDPSSSRIKTSKYCYDPKRPPMCSPDAHKSTLKRAQETLKLITLSVTTFNTKNKTMCVM